MKLPKIDVCVVTYNQREYIETCLRSILDQEVEADVHVLVGDDASTDGTSAIINSLMNEYPGRIQHLLRSPNVGVFSNMRDLLTRTKSDYVARVDGDDYWLPGKLSKQLAYLQERPGCSAVYTNAITIDQDGNRIGEFNDLGDICLDIAALLRRGNVLNNSSVLFRDGNSTGWIEGEQIDYQAHLWQARHGWLGHIGKPLVAYRINTLGSMMIDSNAHVRSLYWRAIESVPRGMVDDEDYVFGITDFLRRVFYRAVRTRDLQLFQQWSEVVYKASPCGWFQTTFYLMINIARMGAMLSLERGRHLLGCPITSILYRH